MTGHGVEEGGLRHAPSNRGKGRVLVGMGLLIIAASVLYVLEAANGPGPGPTRFKDRRSYNQVKVEVHRTFPTAFAIGLVGLGLAIWGRRILDKVPSERQSER